MCIDFKITRAAFLRTYYNFLIVAFRLCLFSIQTQQIASKDYPSYEAILPLIQS